MEFNLWIKSKFPKDKLPRLRSKFGTDHEYEDFMSEYQETHKSYSVDENQIEVDKRDLWEFEIYIQGKGKIKPKLRAKFDTDQDYENFMNEYQDDHLTIYNDPAIIGNEDHPHVSKDQELSKHYSSDDNEIIDEFLRLSKFDPKDIARYLLGYTWESPMIGYSLKKAIQKLGIKSSNKKFSKHYSKSKFQVGDKVRFTKDNFWIMNLGRAGWKKGSEVLISYIDEEGAPFVGGKPNDKYNKGWSVNPKDIELVENSKSFSLDSTTPLKRLETLVGTLIMADSITHLYHLTTYNNYPAHVSLGTFYEAIDPLADSLAEHLIGEFKLESFYNAVTPDKSPMDYLNRLYDYCIIAKDDLFNDPKYSGYQSQMDDITNEIKSCLYKLKRLDQNFIELPKVTSFSIKIGEKFAPTSDEKDCYLYIGRVSKEKSKLEKLKSLIKEHGKFHELMNDCPEILRIKTKDLPDYRILLDEFDIIAFPRKDNKRLFDADNKWEVESEEVENYSKSYSTINNESEFRKYAHTVMKEAHGPGYSEEITDKVVDELIKNNPDSSYGELIGKLTSGLGDKSFAVNEDYEIGYSLGYDWAHPITPVSENSIETQVRSRFGKFPKGSKAPGFRKGAEDANDDKPKKYSK